MRAECPECSATLGPKGCRSCGWKPTEREPRLTKRCEVCREGFELWTALTISDDGLRRCAKCQLAFLKSRACTPADRCPEPGCDQTVAAHIAEAKAYAARMEARLTVSGAETMRAAILRRVRREEEYAR